MMCSKEFEIAMSKYCDITNDEWHKESVKLSLKLPSLSNQKV